MLNRNIKNDVEKIHSKIISLLPNIKKGSLRFWGECFGRPYDNCHTIIKCEKSATSIFIYFDQNVKLTIINPVGFKISGVTFEIKSAEQVIWEWYYYGKPRLPKNLYYENLLKMVYILKQKQILIGINLTLSQNYEIKRLKLFK